MTKSGNRVLAELEAKIQALEASSRDRRDSVAQERSQNQEQNLTMVSQIEPPLLKTSMPPSPSH